jgi:hypothetical protein
MYLGTFVSYNFLYIVNLPMHAAMVIMLIISSLVTFAIFKLDQINLLITKEIFLSIVVMLGLTILEIFLGLYFLSVELVIKGLILVLVYYFLVNLVYLYANSMLRLKKVAGFLFVTIFILAIIIINVWLGLKG